MQTETEQLDPAVQMRIRAWLDGPFDPAIKAEIKKLQASDPKKLADAFFKDLSFGTGGMRGIMGIGTNRMNEYTVRSATQGLANYIKKQPKPKNGYSVFIGYDVRHRSREFAEETAHVLTGNGIQALLAKEVCPTPLVSFACRYYGCTAGVMITASHNPPQYNGYKVYWRDGGQVVLPQDAGILEEVLKVQSPSQISSGRSFKEVGEELDLAYLAELKKMQLQVASPLKIIYSNLHGTGIRLIPKALKAWGYPSVTLVEPQASLDGNFPFAPTPNPEEAKALQMGSLLLEQEKGDLLLATDPDADRMGAAVLHQGTAVPLTGNQIACLSLYHLCATLKKNKKFPDRALFIKTIVTTELFRKIGTFFGGTCLDVLTGFKYIGEQIRLNENTPYQFLFGAEESYGYLLGTFVRDKDSISSSCLLAEAAAAAKQEKRTLIDQLHQIYDQFGVHREMLKNINFNDSQEGMDRMQSMMRKLRENPPSQIGGQTVAEVEDYLRGNANLPHSDVLRYWLADGSKLVIRPSGTEPKVKIYVETVGQAISSCDEHLKNLVQAFEQLIV